MSTYSEYPVFEPNQVLSYTHLNDLVDYLEQQDRLTRRKLIGIGIACGLKVNWKVSEEVLYISKGTAVTSEGYLISLQEDFYNSYLPYQLPEVSMEDSEDGEVDETTYKFFQDDNGDKIEMWQLFPADYIPEEGEDLPVMLTKDFLEEKVILLYLECERESLRNCDINDCSDKGAKMTFEVRILAVGEADAIAILDKEEQIAGRPVHQHQHPKYDLNSLDIEKINPSRYALKNFQEIYIRIREILNKLTPELSTALKDSFEAYRYILTDIYPEANLPSGPFSNLSNHLANVNNDFIQNLVSLQYIYDFYYDVVQSYNEFIHYAHRFEAECCPNDGRFPKHILLGKALSDSSAFIPPAIGGSFNPLSAQTGLAPSSLPLMYRHYFVPSMIYKDQGRLLERVLSLHYRMYLLAFRYDTEIMKRGDIRLTPSKDGDYFLSEKAIPFYYAFNNQDDFHANWSYENTTANKLNRVFSYQFTQQTSHPLLNKMDDYNFYRIEGHVGKGLATVLKNLSTQKKELGLSFAIEPVFIGVTGNDKADAKAMKDLFTAARKLFMCKMRDLDVIFLILVAILFFMLFVLLVLLTKIRRSTYGLRRVSDGTAAAGMATTHEAAFIANEPLDYINKKIVREDSDVVLAKIRKEKAYLKGTVVNEINKDPEAVSLGNMYMEINAESSGGNLYERTKLAVKQKAEKGTDVNKVTEEIYPTVALIDSTEEVMKSLSTDSISKFDFDLFEHRYGNFVDAYQSFNSQKASKQLQDDQDYIKARAYTDQNISQLATTNTQSLLANMSSEFSQRFLNIIQEMTLSGYAKKHPGLEHKAGVPQGGTFILLYAHKDFVKEEFKKLAADLQEKNNEREHLLMMGTSKMAKMMNIGLVREDRNTELNALESRDILARASRVEDPLDNFIVLGDFCIPNQCCEGDCSDIFDEDDEPAQGTISGVVVDAETGRAITQAKVVAVNVSNNDDFGTTVDSKGQFTLQLDPAVYKISAGAKGFNAQHQSRTVNSGQDLNVKFVLQRIELGIMVVHEIANGSAGYDPDTELGREALKYYGSRYAYYNAYALKLDADAISEDDKKVAEEVKSSLSIMMSEETDLNKLNKEVKRVNANLTKMLEISENEKTRLHINESLKVLNSAYLDKLSLKSLDKISPGTSKVIAEIEKTNKNSDVSMVRFVKEWAENNNLTTKPKIVELFKKFRVK